MTQSRETEAVGTGASAMEALFRQSPFGILITADDGRIVDANDVLLRLFGYERDDLLGQTSRDIGLFPTSVRRQYVEKLRSQGFVRDHELQVKVKSGELHDVSISIQPLELGGEPRFVTTVVDISDRKRNERALHESEARYRHIVETTREGVLLTNPDGRLVFVNRRLEEMLGFDAGELLGRDVLDLSVEEDIEEVVRARRTQVRNGIFVRGESKLRCKDGGERWITYESSPVPDGGILTMVTDITAERKALAEKEKLQTQLVFADRLAAVGTLAAGVGHEINNPLAAVSANLDLIGEVLRSTRGVAPAELQELTEMVDEAKHGADRIRKVVRGLKTFSRVEEERRALIDLHTVLDFAINMTHTEVRHRAKLVKDYGTIALVEADETQLGQVFINLLINSAHAMAEGHADTNEIRVVTKMNAAGRVVVEVHDTGTGIPNELLKRVFDPFFTTKGVGQGTGLGLAICYGIVTALGGEIAVDSRLGQGTVVRVHLPAGSAIARARPDSRAPDTRRTPRRGRVLVVDDDATVAKALVRVLRDHEVEHAPTGKVALGLLEAGERFDVIFCDLMMPEMTGMGLHAALTQRLPDVAERMVFITGGAFTPAAREFLEDTTHERVEKPFDAQNLRAIVQRFV